MKITYKKLIIILFAISILQMLIRWGMYKAEFDRVQWMNMPYSLLITFSNCVALVSAAWALYHVMFKRDDKATLDSFVIGSLAMTIASGQVLWGMLFLAGIIVRASWSKLTRN